MKSILKLLAFFALGQSAFGATWYVRDGASGSGTSWSDAYDELSSAETAAARGDTIYIADGSYSAVTFNTATSGSTLITIKKATVADHGTETGWSDTYGDGQATIAAQVMFSSSSWVIDGNGTFTTPTSNTLSYGIRILDGATSNIGVIRFSSGVSNVTLRYVCSENTYGSSDGNYNTANIYAPSSTHLKFQYCNFWKSGSDGISFSSTSFVLIEKCWFALLAELHNHGPDYHGQTIQLFYGGDDYVLRWNVFDRCQGQSLLAIQGDGDVTHRVRFYGNLIYRANDYFATNVPGFNSSGGIIGDAWAPAPGCSNIFIYHNTAVNIGGEDRGEGGGGTPGYSGFRMYPGSLLGSGFVLNNLFYRNTNILNSEWTRFQYNASGGGATAGGSNEITGLSSAIFSDYANENYQVVTNFGSGGNLSTNAWWSTSADEFFGYLDSQTDFYGVENTTWTPGFSAPTEVPAIVTNNASGVRLRGWRGL